MRTYLTTNVGEQNLVSMELKNWEANGGQLNNPGTTHMSSSNATIGQYFADNMMGDNEASAMMSLGIGVRDEEAIHHERSEGQSTTNTQHE